MAREALRVCPAPGCRTITRGGRCEKHRTNRTPDTRPSRIERGYDKRWLKLSKAYRAAHPLCEVCQADGRVTPAAHVHHKVPIAVDPDRRLDWDNLQAVCIACHTRLTKQEKKST